ncbi:MAG: alpha/beta hydrolase fold domain-containing protein [Clostridia bacterium]|nr:alpha/beta hydrolase fold domain-containing protein [Clostridia bacterium]
MVFSAKTLKNQLALFKPLLNSCSLKTMRKGQNKIGELMASKHKDRIIEKEHSFDNFKGAWIIPKDERRHGVILYLHGGGYTCGDLEYAKGFAATLAVETGTRVFCSAYRLAPEYPFPAALDDAFQSYKYLLEKGYKPSDVTLCGESAGGGLCYSLCLRLKQEQIDLPCSIISISPWTDLTMSGKTMETNKDKDPTMTKEMLEFFSDSYTTDKRNVFVSPIFSDLSDMPSSLIFVGEEEVLLDDARILHTKLLSKKCHSKLIIKPDRWHGYLLFGLEEDRKDFELIGRFLNKYMGKETKLRWLKLDNAAKIYPAAQRQNWSNVFRVSATLKEEVDKDVLSSALDVTLRRFPSIAVKLQKGVFWYYLEQLSELPEISEESSYPLTKMSKKDIEKCAFRIIAYKKRIAVELFHSLTDGTGALIFLKSLVAEYLQQKYKISIPAENGVLGRLEDPSPEELEDSFQKYSGRISASRKENTAWHMWGTPEKNGFLHNTCFEIPVNQVLEKAHEKKVSLTTYLCAVMMMALQELQKEKVPNINRRKPIKVLIPVNLRNLFPSKTLRNFALYTTPEILTKLGEYNFDEICNIIVHTMGNEITQKQMSMKIAANVNSERIMAVRVMPLFIKNIVMKAIFDTVGECKSCLSLSNLGNVKIPEVMKEYVERFDFILGVQAAAPYNCGVLSYNDTLYVNFIRDIKEPELEYYFHKVLKDMGIDSTVQSNKGGI